MEVPRRPSTPRHAHVLRFLLLFVAVAVAVGLGEIGVRWLAPQEVMIPRYKESPQFGTSLFPDSRITHERPGRYRFIYTINELGYRGATVHPGGPVPVIVVLGDSYAMGVGVDDGEEFPAVMAGRLRGRYEVVNLGVGGWGLTQQIRRYFEFGAEYSPPIVVLQFSANDPSETVLWPVTRWRPPEFEFHDAHAGVGVVKRVLARSFLQRSQLYNVARNAGWILWRELAGRRASKQLGSPSSMPGSPSVPPEEVAYVELLEPFARRLRGEGVRLVMLSVTHQLGRFEHILSTVRRLDAEGVLEYVDVDPWFEGMNDYASPQGHAWGVEAHARVGERLASHVSEIIPNAASHIERAN